MAVPRSLSAICPTARWDCNYDHILETMKFMLMSIPPESASTSFQAISTVKEYNDRLVRVAH